MNSEATKTEGVMDLETFRASEKGQRQLAALKVWRKARRDAQFIINLEGYARALQAADAAYEKAVRG